MAARVAQGRAGEAPEQQEAARVMDCAIGRLFLIASRPEQPGDVETYYACRTAILDAAEALGISPQARSIGTHRPSWNFGNTVVD